MKTQHTCFRLLALPAALLAMSVGSSTHLMAQVIIPVAVTASSTLSYQQLPINLIDGADLAGTGPNILAYTANATSGATAMWQANNGAINGEHPRHHRHLARLRPRRK